MWITELAGIGCNGVEQWIVIDVDSREEYRDESGWNLAFDTEIEAKTFAKGLNDALHNMR